MKNLKMSDLQGTEDPVLITVSRPELLWQKSDSLFRQTIHSLMAVSNNVELLRVGFGSSIGITGPQHEILMLIARAHDGTGVSVGEVAKLIRRTSPFVATETGRLHRQGLIAKIPSLTDKRKSLLTLTKLGKKKLEELAIYQREINDMLFQTFSSQEFQQFAMLLDKLLPLSEKTAKKIKSKLNEE